MDSWRSFRRRPYRPRILSCSADRGAFCFATTAALADGVPPAPAELPASGGALPARRCSRTSAGPAVDLRHTAQVAPGSLIREASCVETLRVIAIS